MNELSRLRSLTPARVGIGRAGAALPTAEVLDFRLAHARARDAVLQDADLDGLAERIRLLDMEAHVVDSQAMDRRQYVARPDLGRQLSDASMNRLRSVRPQGSSDLGFVVCDGLSGKGVESWVIPLLDAFLPYARESGWSLAPTVLVRNGRVASGDEIGALFNMKLVVVAIGERPGLGSPDSLGLYLTSAPCAGITDEARNCISNVRMDGLPPVAAAWKLSWLCREALRRGITGTALKDEAPPMPQISSLRTEIC